MKKLFFPIALLLFLAGCTSDGSGNGSASSIVTEFGSYTPTVNSYSYVLPANPDETTQSITLWKDNGNSLQFTLNYPIAQTDASGTYQINNTDSATAPFSQGSFLYNGEVYVFNSGTIKVSLLATDRYKITFDVVATNPMAMETPPTITLKGVFKGTITEY